MTDSQTTLQASVAYLLRVAAILRHARFQRLFGSNDSRFGWATEELFAKLRRDFMFQVQMGFAVTRESDNQAHLLALAEGCEQAANRLAKVAEIRVTKAMRAAGLPAGKAGDEAAIIFLSRTQRPEELSASWLRQHGSRAMNDAYTFDLNNALGSLGIFAASLDTLRHPVANSAFEAMLATLDTTWLLGGYPHDLLAHDANAIRNNQPSKKLAYRKDYCSTYMLAANGENEGISFDRKEWDMLAL